MNKRKKLTPKEANQIMKGGMLFLMASMKFHGLIDKVQHNHWIEQFRDIGIYSYTLKEYDENESFEDMMKGGKK